MSHIEGVHERAGAPLKPRIKIDWEGSEEEIDSGLFVNAVLGIVDRNVDREDDAIVDLIKKELPGFPKQSRELAARYFEEIVKQTGEKSEYTHYYDTAQKTVRLTKIAGFIPAEEVNVKS